MSERYDLPLSVLMMDLDDFKKLNDRYGHAVGDAVLRDLARSWVMPFDRRILPAGLAAKNSWSCCPTFPRQKPPVPPTGFGAWCRRGSFR